MENGESIPTIPAQAADSLISHVSRLTVRSDRRTIHRLYFFIYAKGVATLEI